MIKLHLGCGNKHINEWVNIDARQLEGVDLVDDIKTLSSFAEGSVDVIYASHVLEHTGRNEYMDVLSRWFTLLKPGGILRVAVPDIGKVAMHYSQYGDLSVLRGFLWGGQTYPENYHYCGWDYKTLRSDLLQTGFTDVQPYDWRTTEHNFVDDFSQAYLPHMDKDNGTLMSLNVEATK